MFKHILLPALILASAVNTGRTVPILHPIPKSKPQIHSVHKSFRHFIVSSWYGNEFNGRQTANGEIFDQMAMTAASRTLPFGTILNLCYRLNCAMVRVTDRGPFVEGRDLDVSMGVAEVLGFRDKGVARLTWTVVILDKKPKL